MARATIWEIIPPWLRVIPADLVATIGLVFLTVIIVLAPGIRETPLRVVFGLPLVLFLPGYALIAALFPEDGTPPDNEDGSPPDNSITESRDGRDHGVKTIAGGRVGSDRGRGIDGIERVALSFGLSIAIVPLIGLVLNFTPWGIRLLPVLVSISAFSVFMSGVAVQRRERLPPEERFAVPYRDWFASIREEFFEPASRTDVVLNVLLVLSILLAISSVGYAVTVPKPGEAFTEFYLLTEDEDGELIADDYPTEFVSGEPQPVVVGIGNQEHGTENYTVVVMLQRVDIINTQTRLRESVEMDRFGARLAHNETRHVPYRIQPPMTGTRLRLAFLLYRGNPPAETTVKNAYRELHLWVNVTASSSA